MASISEGVDDDDQSVTSAALGIESSATSFTEHSGALHAAAPRQGGGGIKKENKHSSYSTTTTSSSSSGSGRLRYLSASCRSRRS